MPKIASAVKGNFSNDLFSFERTDLPFDSPVKTGIVNGLYYTSSVNDDELLFAEVCFRDTKEMVHIEPLFKAGDVVMVQGISHRAFPVKRVIVDQGSMKSLSNKLSISLEDDNLLNELENVFRYEIDGLDHPVNASILESIFD